MSLRSLNIAKLLAVPLKEPTALPDLLAGFKGPYCTRKGELVEVGK